MGDDRRLKLDEFRQRHPGIADALWEALRKEDPEFVKRLESADNKARGTPRRKERAEA